MNETPEIDIEDIVPQYRHAIASRDAATEAGDLEQAERFHATANRLALLWAASNGGDIHELAEIAEQIET